MTASASKPTDRYDRFSDKDRPPDNRNPGQRDRDRILFTTAFRRLAGVTQVFASDEGHVFHNRLTHSLEVAQVGRRLAEKIANEQKSLCDKAGGIDADVVEAACMAHDLGHPPFGHTAEKTLDELARHGADHAPGTEPIGDLADGFEGNPQSFRIVTKLAFRSKDTCGLNLTRATLNAMLKYPWMRGTAGKKYRKWGAYQSEEDEFKFARALNPAADEKQSAEASIMDWADDITYSVHDLEDFYRARLIPLHILVSDKNERQRFYAAAAARLKTQEAMGDAGFEQHVKAFDPFLDSVPLSESYKGTQDQRSALRTFTAGLIGRYVKASTLVEESSIVGLEIPAGFKREVRMLKQLTRHYVIDNPALATQQYGQRRMIKDLFAIYREVTGDEEYWHVLPASSREQVEVVFAEVTNARDRERALTRIVVDLIAGMTERHAVDMHHRLTGVSLGSVLEHIGRY